MWRITRGTLRNHRSKKNMKVIQANLPLNEWVSAVIRIIMGEFDIALKLETLGEELIYNRTLDVPKTCKTIRKGINMLPLFRDVER